MTAYLLDVNVLIALFDASHIQHDAAHAWFGTEGQSAWATCPLTENGVLRILGSTRYPNSPGSPAAVMTLVARLRELPGHVFWPDNISMADSKRLDASRLLAPGQVTDSYLLALACAHDGQLATFDRRLVKDAVLGGEQRLRVIG